MLPNSQVGRPNQRQPEDRSKDKFVPSRGGYGCPRPTMLLPVRSASFTGPVILLSLLGLYMCSQLGAIDRKVGRIANALDNLKDMQLAPAAAQVAPARIEVSNPEAQVAVSSETNRYRIDKNEHFRAS